MNHVVKLSKGFTLIELMLAMSFIAFLLIAIAMTIIQIGSIYNKGVTVKDLNQSSRTISNDIARVANEARSINLATDLRTSSAGGRLCFGTYSYIWNTAVALEDNDPNLNTYGEPASGELPRGEIRFVKVPDAERIYCAIETDNSLTYPEIRTVDVSLAQELLASGDHRLALTVFDIDPATVVVEDSIEQSLYTLNYTIASGKISAMNSNQTACLEPGDRNSDLTYCNVEPFSLVLRIGNRG